MYLIDPTVRNGFISGLAESPKYRYALTLPTLSITNQSDIEFAAVKLYRSGTPFDNQGRTRQSRMQNEADVRATLAPFVEKIWKYFNEAPNTGNTQANFDRFHEELCELFQTLFAAAGYAHTYGNAQKMVNMLFKYLTCFSDYNAFAGLFEHCHIPIDRKILQALYLYAVPHTTRYGEYQEINPATGKKENTPWTRMDKAQYNILRDAYRIALAPVVGGHSWLGAEYYIWSHTPLPATGTVAAPVAKFYM